jgi:hypothetical protein
MQPNAQTRERRTTSIFNRLLPLVPIPASAIGLILMVALGADARDERDLGATRYGAVDVLCHGARSFEGPWLFVDGDLGADGIRTEGAISSGRIAVHCVRLVPESTHVITLDVARGVEGPARARATSCWIAGTDAASFEMSEELRGVVHVWSTTWDYGEPIEVSFALIDGKRPGAAGSVRLKRWGSGSCQADAEAPKSSFQRSGTSSSTRSAGWVQTRTRTSRK